MPIFCLFFHVRIRGAENLAEMKKPFIIISNHISFYDSFFFRLVSPYSQLPLRFMAVDIFAWPFLNFLRALGVIKFVYSLFGVFTIIPGKGLNANLAKAKEIIHSGGVVVIYPEGRINPCCEVGPFKKGAAALAQRTGASILPVAFKSFPATWFRRQVVISIGKPVSVSLNVSHVNATAMLRKKVMELFDEA